MGCAEREGPLHAIRRATSVGTRGVGIDYKSGTAYGERRPAGRLGSDRTGVHNTWPAGRMRMARPLRAADVSVDPNQEKKSDTDRMRANNLCVISGSLVHFEGISKMVLVDHEEEETYCARSGKDLGDLVKKFPGSVLRFRSVKHGVQTRIQLRSPCSLNQSSFKTVKYRDEP